MIVPQGYTIGPAGLDNIIMPQQGLEIGEELLFLFEKPHDVTKPTRSKTFSYSKKTSLTWIQIPTV